MSFVRAEGTDFQILIKNYEISEIHLKNRVDILLMIHLFYEIVVN